MQELTNFAKNHFAMKTSNTLLTALLLTGALSSCEDFESPEVNGTLSWIIDTGTKASSDIPDTNVFILTVKDSNGKTLYSGSYGDSPASLEVSPGS